MNRHQLIHRATELSDLIDNEPNFTLQKVNWIIEKANIECQLGIHNLWGDSMQILNREIKTFQDIEELVYDELYFSDRWIDNYGSLPSVNDIDDIHDLLESYVNEEDYDEFCNLLDKEKENFCGLDDAPEDPHEAARAAWQCSRL